jgi:hypothetical protein
MTRHSTRSRSMLLFRSATLFAALAWPLVGQALAQDNKSGHVDEKAMAILQGMSDYLSKETTVSFRARTFFDIVQKSGIKVKMGREVKLTLKRPGKFYADTLDESGVASSFWYDGSKFTLWGRSSNEFMTLDFAGDTDKLLDELIDKYEFQIPLADLLYSDVGKALGENMISSEYIGTSTVDGVQCHQLSFESDGADWQIWIEADATPVPCRLVIDYVTEQGEPQYMAQFDAWSLGGEVEDSEFNEVIPEGVKQVEFKKASGEQ